MPTITKVTDNAWGEDGVIYACNCPQLEGTLLSCGEDDVCTITGVKNGEARSVFFTFDDVIENTPGRVVFDYANHGNFDFDENSELTVAYKGATARATWKVRE